MTDDAAFRSGFCTLVGAPRQPATIDRGFEMADRSRGRAVDQVQPA